MAARFLCFLLAIGMSSSIAYAVELDQAAGSYRIDGSRLAFSIANAGGGAMKGEFTSFGGKITIDRMDLARSHVEITIAPDSVSTGQTRIDNFLKSDAVFDASNERRISFTSSAVTRTGDSTARLTGRLTARGKSSAETFDAELVKLDGNRITFHVTGKVYRSRYGMDVGTPIYSNVVDFDMMLTAKRL
jgi:polyisoprenoid-binding protein YceI